MTKDKVTANGRRKAVAILMLVAMMFSVFGAALPERAFAADGTITLKVGRSSRSSLMRALMMRRR